MAHHLSQLKYNSENSRKMYYKTLRVVNREIISASRLAHLMLRLLSPLKNNFRKYIFAYNYISATH
jgi:hypothetical protein